MNWIKRLFGRRVRHDLFFSHSSADDSLVNLLIAALEDRGVHLWVDRKDLPPGEELASVLEDNIIAARHFLVLLSHKSRDSEWVRKEIEIAKAERKRRRDFKLIFLLTDGLGSAAVGQFFPEDEANKPVYISLPRGSGGVQAALPVLLQGLNLQKLDSADILSPQEVDLEQEFDPANCADLVVTFSDLKILTDEETNKRRANAKATAQFHPSDASAAKPSTDFSFEAPLGEIEAGDLRWYLEQYIDWPVGIFKERAQLIEKQLPEWGTCLLDTLPKDTEPVKAWQAVPKNQRRLTIRLQGEETANEAATHLLALPWELTGERVRRSLPCSVAAPGYGDAEQLRVLIVCARPEDDSAAYIDHRASAAPLVEAISALGALADFTILHPPTFPAMAEELRRAREEEKRPYHLVHFDGHGVYDQKNGLGALIFENAEDAAADKPFGRRSQKIDADELAKALNEQRVPCFFLEACQTAQAEQTADASVAAKLLDQGVASVAAMTHSVLVESARRFVMAFYPAIVEGKTVSAAIAAGQRALRLNSFRGETFAGELHLHDWFVPVLYQEDHDPQLVKQTPRGKVREEIQRGRQLQLHALPDPPEHGFVGRSRLLLGAERLLAGDAGYVVFRGEGGEGKTALACELARWLVASRRFEQAAFVSVEQSGDAKTFLWALGTQLDPGFATKAGNDMAEAEKITLAALRGRSTIVVIDNLESVLAPADDSAAAATFDAEVLQALLDLIGRLGTSGATRLIFTSRERLPTPFDAANRTFGISRLSQGEAVQLVRSVLEQRGIQPRAAENVTEREQLVALVESVHCHARALVHAVPKLAQRGLEGTTEDLAKIMEELAEEFGDDRERSLFASVELSLRRLPHEIRALLPPLAVFHGGAQLWCFGTVLELDIEADEEVAVAKALVDAGLVELLKYNYLRFDPALAPSMARELAPQRRQRATIIWADAQHRLARHLYHQRTTAEIEQANETARQDLPNLVAALEWHDQQKAADDRPALESLIGEATTLEGLLKELHRPRALAKASEIRVAAAAQLEALAGEDCGWSHAQFEAERARVERLLETGDGRGALMAAKDLRDRMLQIGESAYPGASYDTAMAHASLARVFRMTGNPQPALPELEAARKGFLGLTAAGNTSADRMASACLNEQGDCLQDLGRLDEAANKYLEAIALAEKRSEPRDVAVAKGQLGTVRLNQGNFAEALTLWYEAREIFESKLREPGGVAVALQQIGRVNEEAGQYEEAEKAYKKSLEIKVQHGDRGGQACSLGQLGNLFDGMKQIEESVRFYREAADIYTQLGDLAMEGRARSNAADGLLKLRRFNDARREILRAIECLEPFGQQAEPWKLFGVLQNLERAAGEAEAAAAARERSIQTYLAYRRDGGEAMNQATRLIFATAQALAAQDEAALGQIREMLDNSNPEDPLVIALQKLLAGDRDPALTHDPELNPILAAELLFTLESLGSS